MNRLQELVADASIEHIVCLGSGGVGKTTLSAALAVTAACQGRHCLVITIDPALRLAQALGLTGDEHQSSPTQVPLDTPGSLWVHQLDPSRVFDDAMRTALAADDAARLMRNPFYRVVADSFAGSVDYMAVEFIAQLREKQPDQRPWDLLVIDTAPATSALDFLDAPDRLAAFTESRFVSLLRSAVATDSRRRVPSLGQSVLALILGKSLASGIADFLNSVHEALVDVRDRARRTQAALQSQQTAFVIITRPSPDQLPEVSRLYTDLSDRGLPVRDVVINQVPPPLSLPVSDTQVAALIANLDMTADDPRASTVADFLRLLRQQVHQDQARDDLVRALNSTPDTHQCVIDHCDGLTDPLSLALLVESAREPREESTT